MPRSLTPEIVQQLEAKTVTLCFLVQINFAEPVHVWSGVGDLAWDGNTYKGVGTLGSLSAVSETSEVEAQGITLTLSGIPAELLDNGLTGVSASSTASVYLGFLDEAGALIPDPIPVYSGMVDQPQINVGTETATVTISVENRLLNLNRSRGGRYTDADQRSRYPNDGCLKYVHANQDHYIRWK